MGTDGLLRVAEPLYIIHWSAHLQMGVWFVIDLLQWWAQLQCLPQVLCILQAARLRNCEMASVSM